MRKRMTVLFVLLVLRQSLATAILAETETPLVSSVNQGLVYRTTDDGDQIPDFSNCGYRGGGVALPVAPVVLTLEARDSGDDTSRIQKAIDEVGKRAANDQHLRGAVLLKAGTYRVSGQLSIKHDGVVLRGEGQGENGSVLLAAGQSKRSLITIGNGQSSGKEVSNSRRMIMAARIPVGSRTIRVDSVDGLKDGDRIVLFRAVTAEWIRTLGMDKLNRGANDKVKNWTPDSYSIGYERTIVAVDEVEKRITMDAPCVCAIDQQYGGGWVALRHDDQRTRNAGVEGLRLISEYEKGEETRDEKHAWNGVSLSSAVDCWVRNVTTVFFGYSCVNISSRASRITVQDCACIDPVSQITGGRRYSFAVSGQQCLVQRCYARLGRHDYVMGSRVPGPNVFLDCVADNPKSDSGPHHRWATGTLYDNIKCGQLNVVNRGRSGTGHGWAGATTVFWNCRTTKIGCQRPPTANNYAIGCTGTIGGSGFIESRVKPVFPRSLYLAQLAQRLGSKAVSKVAISAQLAGPIDDLLRERLAPKAKSLYH